MSRNISANAAGSLTACVTAAPMMKSRVRLRLALGKVFDAAMSIYLAGDNGGRRGMPCQAAPGRPPDKTPCARAPAFRRDAQDTD
jgi:hypothetical protein